MCYPRGPPLEPQCNKKYHQVHQIWLSLVFKFYSCGVNKNYSSQNCLGIYEYQNALRILYLHKDLLWIHDLHLTFERHFCLKQLLSQQKIEICKLHIGLDMSGVPGWLI